jgi:Fe-S cluster assembly ATPase SufC
MLKTESLHAEIGGKENVKGLSFTVNAGEMHEIMATYGS